MTKGEGKAGDEFWTKAETLLYTALIGYIHYEAPEEEQNFNTLLEMLNSMEVREDDEDFENAVDIMFKKLEENVSCSFGVCGRSCRTNMILQSIRTTISLRTQMTGTRLIWRSF